MHIETFGKGPDLVLLHGWAMHGGIFSSLAQALAPDFRLHLVDLPGHGHSAHSPVPLALDAVVDNLARRLPRATWLGWSLGGLFALRAAQRHPERVRALVMLCAPPRFVRAPDWPQGMAAEIFDGFAADLARDYRATIDRFLVLEAHGSGQGGSELAQLRAQVYAAGEPRPEALATGLSLLRDTDLREVLPTLAMPSLWIAGRRDRLVAAAAMASAALLAPGARHQLIASAGHAPFLGHAAQIASALAEFALAAPASA